MLKSSEAFDGENKGKPKEEIESYIKTCQDTSEQLNDVCRDILTAERMIKSCEVGEQISEIQRGNTNKVSSISSDKIIRLYYKHSNKKISGSVLLADEGIFFPSIPDKIDGIDPLDFLNKSDILSKLLLNLDEMQSIEISIYNGLVKIAINKDEFDFYKFTYNLPKEIGIEVSNTIEDRGNRFIITLILDVIKHPKGKELYYKDYFSHNNQKDNLNYVALVVDRKIVKSIAFIDKYVAEEGTWENKYSDIKYKEAKLESYTIPEKIEEFYKGYIRANNITDGYINITVDRDNNIKEV